MVPSEGLPLEQLEGSPWEAEAIEETSIDWTPSTGESLDAYRKRITELVDGLWAIAQKWTHSQGVWCDYKLVGLNNLEVVFEKGKRCQGPPEETHTNADSPDGTKRDETPSNELHDFLGHRELERRVNRRMEDFLDRMTEDRNRAFGTAQESLMTALRARDRERASPVNSTLHGSPGIGDGTQILRPRPARRPSGPQNLCQASPLLHLTHFFRALEQARETAVMTCSQLPASEQLALDACIGA